MAPSKRRPLHSNTGGSGGGSPGSSFRSSRMNFRPSFGVQEDRGGTRPTTSPSSIGLILITMLIHLCKKSLLFDPRLKVAIYCGAIFLVSLIADTLVMPKTFFSRSDNLLNRWFVKWGWGWLLTVTIPWVSLTAYTLGCGRRSVLTKHLGRLVLATLAWLFWTKMFNFIENNYGRCLNTKEIDLQTKVKCLQSGRFWNGFDISGHTFILIYSSLILAEEGSTLVGWEGISDLVMKEEHSRSVPETSTGPLKNLTDHDLQFLKKAHSIFTPYLRGLFVIMTMQQLLWDVMLISTMLYYHIMIEKFIGGIIAVITWYITYRCLFKIPQGGLASPGEGLFKYNETKETNPVNVRIKRNTLNGSTTPKFMGMPLRTGQQEANEPAGGVSSKDSEILPSR